VSLRDGVLPVRLAWSCPEHEAPFPGVCTGSAASVASEAGTHPMSDDGSLTLDGVESDMSLARGNSNEGMALARKLDYDLGKS
jgi:hypothetical protein